jgi:potassium efflux system protein
LAESHFEWPAKAVWSLRLNLLWLMVCTMPLLFVTAVLYSIEPEEGRHSLGRVMFIVTSAVVAFFLGRTLRPNGGVLLEYLADHSGGWIDRLRYVWFAAGVCAPLSLAALAFFGYYYTALQLAWKLYLTLLLIAALVVLHSFLLRLLLVYRRRLSMNQARERRAAALAARDAAGAVEASPPGQVVAVEEAVDLAQLNTQTQRLVTATSVVVLVIGAWMIWEDVIPALGILDRWPLWTTVDTVSETTTDEAGETVVTTREVLENVTFADLLLALLIGIITFVGLRNLPGLMEMFVLQRLPLEASVRYAIRTLAGYGIIVFGVALACSIVGLGWSQIQWLATALTFGLAFGLQEIFANFVAGLIILFERPIRVGDVVTVSNVTGIVSRVRIRATTITDWDRKEFVVPNKEFITGQVLNWTLTDKTNRITINVGVAYGAETEKARDLLLKIANEHPLVMDTPAPIATFEGFGDSALNLVLRVYLPTMDNRLTVMHELHTAIHEMFAREGLEIAFPQLDLHVRTFDSALRVAQGRGGSG